jgi:2-methylcitrate dehydratase PrpD
LTTTRSRSDVTSQLTSLALRIGFEDLPAHVIRFAKHCVLDFVAVAIAGRGELLPRILLEDAMEEGGRQVSSVIGTSLKVTPPQAALLNGAAGHVLDYDDTNFTMNGHISVASLPALFALSELDGRSGRDLLAAYVAGVDFGCRVGLLVEPGHYLKGFHATATAGTFAAAAASSHLLKLSHDGFRQAVGLAGTQAAGLKSMFGTMGKPFHAGRAAQTGLTSAVLARRGFKGQPAILEIEQGFAWTHSPDFDPDAALAAPKRGFHILSTLFKYSAACYGTHAAIQAGRQAVEKFGPAMAVRKVIVEVGAVNGDVCNIQEPETELEARFSIRLMTAYALASMDTSNLENFHPRLVTSEPVRSLRDKVEVVLREDFSITFARLTVLLDDGSQAVFEAECGEPSNDLDMQEKNLALKFAGLTRPTLGEKRARALLDQLLALEDITDLGSLQSFWSPEPGQF